MIVIDKIPNPSQTDREAVRARKGRKGGEKGAKEGEGAATVSANPEPPMSD